MDETRAENTTILVVEDYEDTSLAMRLALEDEGYHILEAADGEQAVEVAAHARPEIILMDLNLPKLDGLGATRRIRSNPELSDAIIVAVTAYPDADHRARALAAGCNAYVTKPIDFDFLKDLLANLMS
jgi:two-component system cell cycle response regulator DivK